MSERVRKTSNRDALINAGIAEINSKGLVGFSVRHAAEMCGVSCAAPAKHFGDKSGYLAAVMREIIKQWHDVQKEIVKECGSDTRKALVESSIAYIRFLNDNPHFISMLTVSDKDYDNIYKNMRFELSYTTGRIVIKYCKQVGMPLEVRERKLYVVRSLIYGAAMMFDNGEMEISDEALDMVRNAIDREFDLP